MATEGIILTSQFVSSIIGKDLMTKAISDSANSIYNLLYGIVDYRDHSIDTIIDELDIQNKINIVEQLIEQIEEREITKLIMISLTGLHDIILNIREDLKQISTMITVHRDRYFYYWRSIDFTVQKKQLCKHVNILNSRLDMLMKILSISQHFQNSNKIKHD